MRKKFFLASALATIFLLTGCEGVISPQPNNPNQPNNPPSQGTNPVVPDDPVLPDPVLPDGGADGEHKDENDDGVCDDCNESVLLTLDVYSINDLHGKFADTDTQPGVDELTTYLKNARTQNENTIFLSSGDMWQGSSESNLTKGKILTEWMNELNFSSMTLGNHEYDWGEAAIEANAQLAQFPLLAINIFDTTTNQRVDYCQPSVLIETSQAKIGIIGAIGDCYSSMSADKVAGVEFKTGSQLTQLVKEESARLRGAGADFIIYSIHDGHEQSSSGVGNIGDGSLSYYDISLSRGYVDLVFEGHTHQNYTLIDSEGVYHLQDGGDNDGVSHAQISVNFAGGSSKVESARFVSTYEYTSLVGDEVVQTLLDKYATEIQKADEVLGLNDKIRNSDQIRTICAELYYKAGMERWGAEYDIFLGGVYMSVRSPYNLAAGTVTYGDLMSLLPFDNALVLCSISGRNLKNRFFNTTNSDYFIYFEDYGEEVKYFTLDVNATYYIVADTYSLFYSPNGLTEVARYDEETFARDLLADYIKAGGLTANANTEKKLTSIPEALSIGGALGENEETAEKYYVRGKVVSIASTKYGNMTIEDENGNRLYVYGVYDETGRVRYDAMSNPPQVGDTIILYGAMKNYVNGDTHIVEMVSGWQITSWTP